MVTAVSFPDSGASIGGAPRIPTPTSHALSPAMSSCLPGGRTPPSGLEASQDLLLRWLDDVEELTGHADVAETLRRHGRTQSLSFAWRDPSPGVGPTLGLTQAWQNLGRPADVAVPHSPMAAPTPRRPEPSQELLPPCNSAMPLRSPRDVEMEIVDGELVDAGANSRLEAALLQRKERRAQRRLDREVRWMNLLGRSSRSDGNMDWFTLEDDVTDSTAGVSSRWQEDQSSSGQLAEAETPKRPIRPSPACQRTPSDDARLDKRAVAARRAAHSGRGMVRSQSDRHMTGLEHPFSGNGSGSGSDRSCRGDPPRHPSSGKSRRQLHAEAAEAMELLNRSFSDRGLRSSSRRTLASATSDVATSDVADALSTGASPFPPSARLAGAARHPSPMDKGYHSSTNDLQLLTRSQSALVMPGLEQGGWEGMGQHPPDSQEKEQSTWQAQENSAAAASEREERQGNPPTLVDPPCAIQVGVCAPDAAVGLPEGPRTPRGRDTAPCGPEAAARRGSGPPAEGESTQDTVREEDDESARAGAVAPGPGVVHPQGLRRPPRDLGEAPSSHLWHSLWHALAKAEPRKAAPRRDFMEEEGGSLEESVTVCGRSHQSPFRGGGHSRGAAKGTLGHRRNLSFQGNIFSAGTFLEADTPPPQPGTPPLPWTPVRGADAAPMPYESEDGGLLDRARQRQRKREEKRKEREERRAGGSRLAMTSGTAAAAGDEVAAEDDVSKSKVHPEATEGALGTGGASGEEGLDMAEGEGSASGEARAGSGAQPSSSPETCSSKKPWIMAKSSSMRSASGAKHGWYASLLPRPLKEGCAKPTAQRHRRSRSTILGSWFA